MEIVTYDKKSRTQIRDFLLAYVELCKAHGIRLGASECAGVCPIVDGVCDTSVRWLDILGRVEHLGEHRRPDPTWRKRRVAELTAELASLQPRKRS